MIRTATKHNIENTLRTDKNNVVEDEGSGDKQCKRPSDDGVQHQHGNHVDGPVKGSVHFAHTIPHTSIRTASLWCIEHASNTPYSQ